MCPVYPNDVTCESSVVIIDQNPTPVSYPTEDYNSCRDRMVAGNVK